MRRLGIIALVAGLYFTTGRLGLSTAVPPGVATAIWPPSGLALAAILLGGSVTWPGIFLGSVLVNWGTVALPLAGLIGLGSTVQALAGARLVRRFIGTGFPLNRAPGVFKFLGVAAAASLIAATLGTAALGLGGLGNWAVLWRNWLTWWVGDLVGILVVAPAPLALKYLPLRREVRGSAPEGGLLIALALGAALFVFDGNLGAGAGRYPLEFLLIPFVLWAAYRFGRGGAVAMTVLLAAVSVWGTVKGWGPFAGGALSKSLLFLQLFLGVVSGLGLLVGALVQERRESAAELERSNRDLEQFASVASHDLKEPLRTVSIYAGLLQRSLGEKVDGDSREALHFLVDATGRMTGLINDLLSYSRLGTSGGARTRLECGTVVKQVLEGLRASVRESGAEVTCAELPSVTGDGTQIRQLFQNLLANALKYRKPDVPPRIHIFCEAKGREWVFGVRDNGIGMEMKYAERIFLAFRRLHHRTEYPGTGIGLAVCKRIVENHGGRIWVESRVGEGSLFLFTLPHR